MITPAIEITFFERFEKDILSEKKTITIRDEAESHYEQGSTVKVSTFEDNREFCHIKIKDVVAIDFSDLNETHAEQENMTLPELKSVIQDIYPNIKQLFVLSFELVK